MYHDRYLIMQGDFKGQYCRMFEKGTFKDPVWGDLKDTLVLIEVCDWMRPMNKSDLKLIGNTVNNEPKVIRKGLWVEINELKE